MCHFMSLASVCEFTHSVSGSPNAMTYDWEVAVVGACPVCGQGDQWIVCERATGKLYICCQECFAEWESPENLGIDAVHDQEKYGPFSPMRVVDLREHPWFAFVINKGVLGP